MKRKWISILVSLAIALSVWILTPWAMWAAGSILHYPLNIAADATFTGSTLTTGTPFAIYIQITGAPANTACNGPKIRLMPAATGGTADSSFRTWTGATYGWLPDNGAWASFPSITTDGAGSWSGWAYGAVPTAAANTWLEGRINCGGTNHSTSARVQVTLLNMSSTGGWLEESSGTSRAGRAVVVRTGSTIIGMYAVENNNITEGYSSTPGYFRVAVPACTTCGYTIETWDLASPGTAVGTINTMGTNSCPDAITVASITSLNSCTVPTSITLKSISAYTTPEANALLIFAGTLAVTVTTIVLLLRRSRAA